MKVMNCPYSLQAAKRDIVSGSWEVMVLHVFTRDGTREEMLGTKCCQSVSSE